MKIAIVTETDPPEINGVALTVQSMVLHSLRIGHSVVLIRPRGPDLEPIERDGLSEYRVASLPLPRYGGLRIGVLGAVVANGVRACLDAGMVI